MLVYYTSGATRLPAGTDGQVLSISQSGVPSWDNNSVTNPVYYVTEEGNDNNDWRGFYNNKSLCVLFPESVNNIKKIVTYCYKKNIKIVPQGGNTSLTGASVPTYNNKEIIINFAKLNKI